MKKHGDPLTVLPPRGGRGRPCLPGCRCDKHRGRGSRACPPGCKCARHVRSPETRVKLSETKLREANPTWTGDGASYEAIHARLRSLRGPASAHACADCSGQAGHWSYDGGDPGERVATGERRAREKGLAYSTDPGYYSPRCVPCHRNHDRGRIPA